MKSTLNRPGLTLVEVLLSMTILLIVSAACLSVLQFNTKASLGALKRVQASQYLDQIRSHLTRFPSSQLESRYSEFPQIIDNPEFSAGVQIDSAHEDGSRQAVITVEWPSGATTHSMSASVTLMPR